MICALLDFEQVNQPTQQTSSGVPIANSNPIQTRKLIKVDEYGEASTFDAYSNADYDETTNLFNINATNNVSFNDEQLINGGAFTIMFLYQGYTPNGVNSYEEFVSFKSDPSVIPSDDIIIRRLASHGILSVVVGNQTQSYSNVLNMSPITKIHFTIVIIPNGGVKVYMNGIEVFPSASYITLGDIPAKTYTYQNLGGTDSKLKGSIGNFRFYNKELTEAEISAIGSVGRTNNDLLTFNLTTRLFQAQPRQLIKVDEYGEHSTFNTYSNAPYSETTNMWNINGTNNVSFNDEPLINGGAFTIMFSYKTFYDYTTNLNEEFVSFRTGNNVFEPEDILIRKSYDNSSFLEVRVGNVAWIYNNLIDFNTNIKQHFTIVIIPNFGFKVYKNGVFIEVSRKNNNNLVVDIPAKIYNLQAIGGTGSKLKGSIGNFRFYDRELSSAEISGIGSVTNDLVPFVKINEIFTTANVGYITEASAYPTFRCKMPTLPSDVPHMMGIEVLQASIPLNKSYYPYTGSFLYLLDNADNCHNNTLKNEICLSRLENVAWRYYPNGVNTGQAGITSFEIQSNKTPIKMYIPTKQNYLYFQLQDKGTKSDGNIHVVNKAKIIIRLTFDTKQNEYKPKRIML